MCKTRSAGIVPAASKGVIECGCCAIGKPLMPDNLAGAWPAKTRQPWLVPDEFAVIPPPRSIRPTVRPALP